MEAGDTAAVAAAVATASAAHARSNMAMEANSKGHKLSQQYDQQEPKRSKQEQQTEAADDGQVPVEAAGVAAAADDMGAADARDAGAAGAAPADADTAGAADGNAGVPAAAEAAAAGDAGAEAGAPKAAAGNGQLAYQPSWARGGGGRGRSGQGQGALQGGRFRGIDPIYPVEDPKILKVGSTTRGAVNGACKQPAPGPSSHMRGMFRQ